MTNQHVTLPRGQIPGKLFCWNGGAEGIHNARQGLINFGTPCRCIGTYLHVTWPYLTRRNILQKNESFRSLPSVSLPLHRPEVWFPSNCPASNVSGEILCWSAILMRRNDKSHIVSPLVPCKQTNCLEKMVIGVERKEFIINMGLELR